MELRFPTANKRDEAQELKEEQQQHLGRVSLAGWGFDRRRYLRCRVDRKWMVVLLINIHQSELEYNQEWLGDTSFPFGQ